MVSEGAREPDAGPPSRVRARLGFGAWGVGGAGWGAAGDEAVAEATVRRALELGVSFFDTAPTYGGSEALLGRVLRGAGVAIATKVGPDDDPRASLEASLRRLRTDRVDLLQLHEPGPRFERSLEGMARLRDEGKAGRIGVSNVSPRQLRRACEIAPVEALQAPYNLVDRDAEQRLLPFCREHGLDFLAYRPLASGLLTGKYEEAPAFGEGDHRAGIYWFRDREFERRREVVERLRPIAVARGVALAALSLGWALARPGVAVVLAGARTPEQVEQNVAAAAEPPTDDGVAAIDRAVAEVFRPPRAAPGALAASAWGERERFILERLDGETSFEEIAAAWTDEAGQPMVAAQVKVFADRLVEGGMAARD